MTKEMQQFLDRINAETDKEIKNKFGNEIRTSFLLDIRKRVQESIGPTILNLYEFKHDMIAPGDNYVDNDLCKLIIGCHHSNTVYLKKKEVYTKEVDKQYKERLTKQVANYMMLRGCACRYFRGRDVILAERYIYYPVPYLLFAMCMRMNEIIRNTATKSESIYYITLAMQKAMATLMLLEDQMLDTAYMPCRTGIETFIKLLLFRKHPHLFNEVRRFELFEIEKTCNHVYSDDFNDSYSNRINQTRVSKAQYMHYGFVDAIDEYHEQVRREPYSLNGIIRFLEEYEDDNGAKVLETLKHLYITCHGYIHGNVVTTRYPVLHYFEVSMILGFIIPTLYSMLCKETNNELLIYGQDVMALYKEEFDLLREQYNMRNTENLEIELKKMLSRY